MNILKNYKFSIIIPNFNGGKFIEGCIKSILNQNYENYEIIIIDGKSTDNSHKIISKFINNNIKWIKKKDKGISEGFNIGIKESIGDFILFLGSDDYLYNNILEKINNYINHINNFSLIRNDEINIFCDSINYFSKKNIFEKRVFPTTNINKNNLIRYGTLVGLQNIYFNKSYISHHKLNENNKYSMDYEVYFRMIKDRQTFIYLPEINTVNYQGNNISCKLGNKSFKESILVAKLNATNIKNFFYIYKKICIFNIIILIKGLLKK